MKRGIIAGAFDLLHPGHLYTFRVASEMCDGLTVALHVDPSIERKSKNKPVQTVFERYTQLRACKYVDQIIPYETENDLVNMLCLGGFDIRFVGSEYRDQGDYQKITGWNIVPIEYINRYHDYSSTELRKRLHDHN